MKWQKKLTKKEFRHLKEEAFELGRRITLAGLERTFAHHRNMRKINNHNPAVEPCWICRGIAKKLGFEV